MTLLKVDRLSKTYRGETAPAVDNVSLEIPEHGVFGFLGPNGAGKTTTIKVLTGLMNPTGGEIRLKNKLMDRRSREMRSRLGYLGQEPRYYPWMTGEELLLMTAGLFGLSPEESQKRTEELLELTGIPGDRKKRIGAYSGGMVQRLGIAQALVNRPEVLFLDEPISALDPLGRKEILDLIARLKETTTVFMSTHILTDVERVCDRVGILKEGRLIALETTESLKEKYAPRRKELLFTGSDACLRAQAWLEERQVTLREVCGGKPAVTLAEKDFLRLRPALLEFLGTHSLTLESLTDRSADLEEIFITLVGAGR